MESTKQIIAKIRNGDQILAARLMRDVDDENPKTTDILRALYSHTGNARILGITGAPGAGKSTLVDRLISELRSRGKTVAIVAVDPTSPFTGGAILGDRIRMQRHTLDEGVFIRSLATRGALGGISRSSGDVVRILDAMGFDYILVETVGVGQDEVEIVKLAEATLVVLVPGLGDDVQSIKAGILEIADIFVINKSDRPGADRVVRDIQAMIELGNVLASTTGRPSPQIVKTIATQGEGIAQLIDQVEQRFLSFSEETRKNLRKRRALAELSAIVEEKIRRKARIALKDVNIEDLATRKLDPYTLADRLIDS